MNKIRLINRPVEGSIPYTLFIKKKGFVVPPLSGIFGDRVIFDANSGAMLWSSGTVLQYKNKAAWDRRETRPADAVYTTPEQWAAVSAPLIAAKRKRENVPVDLDEEDEEAKRLRLGHAEHEALPADIHDIAGQDVINHMTTWLTNRDIANLTEANKWFNTIWKRNLRPTDEIIRAMNGNDYDHACSLIRESEDPSHDNNRLLITALAYGREDVVRELARNKLFDPYRNSTVIIQQIVDEDMGPAADELATGQPKWAEDHFPYIIARAFMSESVPWNLLKRVHNVVRVDITVGYNAYAHEYTEAFPNSGTPSPSHFLYMACLDGQIDFVRDLLGNDDVDPAWECLNTAVGSGHRDVVQALLDDGRIDPRWGNGEAAVTAIVRNHERVLRTLLDDGRIATPAILGRMLMLVCRLGGTKLLQQLLRVAETDTNAAPPSSLSPLETAILRRHYGIVRELLDDRRTQIPPGIEGLMNHARNMGAENMYRTLQRNERVAKFLEERKGAQEQS